MSSFKLRMGGLLSTVWWGSDPDEVNPVSGMTRREIYAVQKSWAPVYANNLATGTELLIRYFRAYPESKQFFRMIGNRPEDEYTNNHQFKAHVIGIMSSFNQAVNTLDQPEVVAAMMTKLGESHGKRKIKEKHYHDLKNVILKMFIEVFNFDEKTLSAWGKTVDFWYKHIFESLAADRS